jgi:hypothetical protein
MHNPNPKSADKSSSDPFLSRFSTTHGQGQNLSTPDQSFLAARNAFTIGSRGSFSRRSFAGLRKEAEVEGRMSLLTWTVSDSGGHYADFGRYSVARTHGRVPRFVARWHRSRGPFT